MFAASGASTSELSSESMWAMGLGVGRRDGSAPVMGRSWASGWAVRTGWRWRKKREDEESGGRRKKEVKPERENGKCLLMREIGRAHV